MGVIVVLASFFLLKRINISAGIAISGIVLIMYAFIRGWEITDDRLKFAVALIIAVIVIILAVKVNKRLSNKK